MNVRLQVEVSAAWTFLMTPRLASLLTTLPPLRSILLRKRLQAWTLLSGSLRYVRC